MVRRVLRWWLGTMLLPLLVWAGLGCSDEDTVPSIPIPDGGVIDASPDGGAAAAGPIPGACEPGQLALEDGSCEAAGVPPESCGQGFEADGERGCTAILPVEPCGLGTLAIPGETTCHEVAPCGTDRWHSIPTDGSTQYVDGGYPGSDSDGTSGRPWVRIQDAVAAASPDAVIAIAQGSYVEDVLILDQPVQLWGTCPRQVQIVGDVGVLPTVYVNRADGTEVHQLAVTGPGAGIDIHASLDVVIDRVWIHHTASIGLAAYAVHGPSSVHVSRSLLEWTRSSGAETWEGAELRLEESVVRDTQPDAGAWGWGLAAYTGESYPLPSRLEIRRSVIERNREVSIQALSSDLVIEDAVIRDTLPNVGSLVQAAGILVAPFMEDLRVSTFELRRSTVERSQSCAVCAIDAATTIEHTTIGDTAPQASDGLLGYGLVVASEAEADAERVTATIRHSTIRDSHALGFGAAAVDAVVDGLLVRNTAAANASGMLGRGVVIELNPATGVSATAEIEGCLVEDSHEVGLLVLGAAATLEGVAVRGTRVRPGDGRFGRGLIAQLSAETLAPASAMIRHSLIEDCHEAGLYAAGAEVVVEDSIVRGCHRRPSDGRFGDGVIGSTLRTPGGAVTTSLRIDRCLVGENDRAGVASFGARVALGASLIDCNALDINGETYEGVPSELTDLGDNRCGCGAEVEACQVLSAGLAPPEPLAP